MLKKIIIMFFILSTFNFTYALDENLLKSLIKDGAYEEALDLISKENKESYEYLYYSGLIYKEELNLQQAKFYYEKALGLKEVPEACAEYGDILLKLNEIRLLGNKLVEWEKKGLKDNRIDLVKAQYYRKTKSYKNALETLNKIKDDENLEENVLKEKILIYFEMNDKNNAIVLLNSIITGKYSDGLKDFAFQYLRYFSAIGNKTSLKLFYMYGYDNNVVSEPSDKYYAALISGKDDTVHLFGFNLNHFRPYQNFSLNINYDLGYSAYNHLSEYNYLTNDLNLAGYLELNKNFRVSLAYNLFYSLLDEEGYLIINGIQPGITYLNDSTNMFISIYPFFEKREFIIRPANQFEDRDGYKYGSKLELTKRCGKNFFSFGYMYARDNTEGYNWRSNQNQFYLRGFLRPFEKLATDIYLSYRIDDFLNLHKTFLVERYDKVIDLVFLAEYYINKTLSVVGKYVYINSNSNITLYDYQRRQITIGLQVRF